MTRREAAALLFVGFGLYCLLVSLGYLCSLIELFAPMTPLPADWNPAVYFASYLIPFGALLAAGQLLIRGRHALADQLLCDDGPSQAVATQPLGAGTAGSLVFTLLGLLAFFIAIERLPAVIQILQPHNWRSVSATRAVLLAVFQPLLLLAYVLLGWYVLTRRTPSPGDSSPRTNHRQGRPTPAVYDWRRWCGGRWLSGSSSSLWCRSAMPWWACSRAVSRRSRSTPGTCAVRPWALCSFCSDSSCTPDEMVFAARCTVS